MTILIIIFIAVIALGAMTVCIGGTDLTAYLVYRNSENQLARDTARKQGVDASQTIAFGVCIMLAGIVALIAASGVLA